MVQVVLDAIQHTMLKDLGHYWEKRDGVVMACGLLHPFCGQVQRKLVSSHLGETLVAVIC